MKCPTVATFGHPSAVERWTWMQLTGVAYQLLVYIIFIVVITTVCLREGAQCHKHKDAPAFMVAVGGALAVWIVLSTVLCVCLVKVRKRTDRAPKLTRLAAACVSCS